MFKNKPTRNYSGSLEEKKVEYPIITLLYLAGSPEEKRGTVH